MTSIAAYPLVRASAQKRESQSVRAVEKIRPRAQFNGEYREEREASSWICVPLERTESSHRGTEDNASYWDAPRLKAEFAAQVLGQAMEKKPHDPSALHAYAKTAVILRPRFDKNV